MFDYINDVHLDFWVPINSNQVKFEKNTRLFAESIIPDNPSDTLVIGGDLGHYNFQNYWFLETLSLYYKNIILVLGNHDYYMVSDNQAKKYHFNSIIRVEAMKEMTRNLSNIFYLEGDIVDTGGFKIGGTGMWYDFQYSQQVEGMTLDDIWVKWAHKSRDYKYIKGFFTIEKFENEKEKLLNIIKRSDVILTHVGPDWSFSPRSDEDSYINSFYFFDGKKLIESLSPKIWCFGHIHNEIDFTKNNIRFINHPLGYPDESKFKKAKQVKF